MKRSIIFSLTLVILIGATNVFAGAVSRQKIKTVLTAYENSLDKEITGIKESVLMNIVKCRLVCSKGNYRGLQKKIDNLLEKGNSSKFRDKLLLVKLILAKPDLIKNSGNHMEIAEPNRFFNAIFKDIFTGSVTTSKF